MQVRNNNEWPVGGSLLRNAWKFTGFSHFMLWGDVVECVFLATWTKYKKTVNKCKNTVQTNEVTAGKWKCLDCGGVILFMSDHPVRALFSSCCWNWKSNDNNETVVIHKTLCCFIASFIYHSAVDHFDLWLADAWIQICCRNDRRAVCLWNWNDKT